MDGENLEYGEEGE